MTAVKKLALSACVLGISSTSVQAGPMSRSSWRWTSWVSNRSTPVNGGYSSSGSPTLNLFTPNQPSSTPAPTPVAPPLTLGLAPSETPAPAPTPIPSISGMSTVSNAVEASTAVEAAPAAFRSSGPVDAYVDLNGGPYLNAGALTTGGAQAWYNSPAAIQAYGGIPNAQQQASFDQAVLAHVQQTFQLSGMNPTLTLDPSASALHTVSVVSNTSNASDPNAIGMTEVGGNGFGYIDKLAPLNLTSDQLAWAVAHNVSHELMHAFGIGTHPDQTGTYLDSASASLSVLTDPGTTFSPAAVQLIKATDYGANIDGSMTNGAEKLTTNPNHVGPGCSCIFCRGIYGGGSVGAQALESPVPEPSTIFIWGTSLAAAGFVLRRNRDARRAA